MQFFQFRSCHVDLKFLRAPNLSGRQMAQALEFLLACCISFNRRIIGGIDQSCLFGFSPSHSADAGLILPLVDASDMLHQDYPPGNCDDQEYGNPA